VKEGLKIHETASRECLPAGEEQNRLIEERAAVPVFASRIDIDYYILFLLEIISKKNYM
jgi:hypothetical protein